MKKLIIAILILIPLSAFTQLTGYWQTDVGGCYHIKQQGNEVWWASQAGPGQVPFNVFHGAIVDNILTGWWYDLPSNPNRAFGESLSLRIENNNRMVKTNSSVNYSGSVWLRQNGPCNGAEEYWEVTGAGGWSAVWTRRPGNSNTYDGVWTGPQGQKSKTVIEIVISGNKMTGKRTLSEDGILCNYNGQMSPDGRSVSGTASCTTGSPWNWSAIIRK